MKNIFGYIHPQTGEWAPHGWVVAVALLVSMVGIAYVENM